MTNDITFRKEALAKIQSGVDKLANIVKTTLGPGGANVILQRSDAFHITKDGVSVASEVYLDDEMENMGAQIIKNVARKTVREAGDGTTTAIVLAQAILNEGIRLAGSGARPIDVKKGIDMAIAEAVKELKAMSKKVEGDDIRKVALISANGDQEIGTLVADAINAVGLEGLVTVESSNSLDTYSKRVNGMRWDRGYKSPYFVTNQAKMECELIDPVVLVVDGNITSLTEIMGKSQYNIIQRYREGDPELRGKPLLIIANDFGQELITALALNHQKNAITCCLVEAPEFDEARKSILGDIAALVGATVMSKEAGHTWANITTEMLGRCESVRINQWNTTIIGGRGGMKSGQRAEQIRQQMTEAKDHALVALQTRLARLVEGLMVIYVGGASDVEVQEKKDRIDDALNATKAAMEEGVVPGGGVSYIRAGMKIGHNGYANPDHQKGKQIVLDAMLVPFKTLCENVGELPEVAIKEVMENDNESFGFNAANGHFEDLIAAGVIDPVKVVRLALENAGSVSGMLLTASGVVSNKKIQQR